MPERSVDVKTGGTVLHTFPITVSDWTAETGEDGFKAKALEAAANAKLAPNKQLEALSVSMHVSRGAPLEPAADLGALAETKEGLDQLPRERAYSLWQRKGSAEGRADEYWYRTLEFERG